MKYHLDWTANEKGKTDVFAASVPGNVQNDYAKAHQFADLQQGNHFTEYRWMEDVFWDYHASFDNPAESGEALYFVSEGIDYECDIFLNDVKLCHHVGMYSKIQVELTPYVKQHNQLRVEVYPIPKSVFSQFEDRDQANQAVKPAVSYGWDWHPRLVPSGMWQDAYLETQKEDAIKDFEVTYELSEDMTSADVHFRAECASKVEVSLYSPDGELIYRGFDDTVHLDQVLLWWCNGQGQPFLYRYTAKTDSDCKEGTVGFRRVRLVMNQGAWDEPEGFPKTRSNPPITIELNGRRIFAKGSNWVNPEIFVGTITDETYRTQLSYAKEAHMNLLRVHGGTIVNKKAFYEYCDQYGIMVWQEFTLACNHYVPTKEYLEVLNREATFIIQALRRYACHVIWCGGNELFNNWSGMTDQSPALRLLNKLCYEYDADKPYLMTSPLSGMAHGHYVFYDFETKEDVFQVMGRSRQNAYTEFAVPSMAPLETIKRVIPDKELDSICEGTAWESHCGLNSWRERTWICDDVIAFYFGKPDSLEQMISWSNLLQCEGYKAIFGEARRQWPRCSMALNWDFNEPWMNVAGNNLLAYPSFRKPAYYAVQQILKPITFSVKAERFAYRSGEELSVTVYYHNDTMSTASDSARVYVIIGDNRHCLCTFDAMAQPMQNQKGPTCHMRLPSVSENTLMKVLIAPEQGEACEFVFLLRADEQMASSRFLNQ